MACQLYTQDDLTALYSVVYGEILDRINNPSLGKFDQSAFDNLIKTIYEELKDNPDNAIIYAQAVPDIFNLVANDPEIKRYLVKEVGFNFNYPNEKALDFEDLEVVKQFVSPKSETFDDVENRLKEINKTKNDIVISDDSELSESELESRNAAKIEFPNVTSLQTSASKNPAGFKKGDDRNPEDRKKTVFNIVQKNIIASINFSSIDQTEVLYGDTPIIISATKSSAFPNQYKLAEHLSSEDSESVGIYAVITDTDGNYIFFDKDGNITDAENGTVVYTFLRKVEKVDGILTLLYSRTLGKGENRKLYKYKNTLVDALKIANREANILAEQGGEITNDWVDTRAQEIFDEQKALMNGLYKLRKEVEASENPVKLNITGGSLGIAPELYPKPISQLGITEEDLATYEVIKDDNNTKVGRSVITVYVDTPIGRIPQIIDMQRGDFDDNLVEKVATVLTTKAKLPSGKELDNEQRQAYFEVFIDNSLEKLGNGFYSKYNRENIIVKIKDGALVVSIKDFEGKETVLTGDALYTDKAKDIIKAHLKKTPKKGKTYPASVHFNEQVKALGYFPDYEVNGDKITVNTVMYIPFIKNYAKANFSAEYAKFAYGNNPYLTYEIPAEYMTDSEYAIEAENEKVKSAPPKTNEEKYEESREITKSVSEEIPFEEELDLITDDTVDKVDLSDMPDDLGFDFDVDEFERSKKLDNFLDKLFITEEDKANAEAWWANSPLSKYISLNRISQIVNSNAFATFSKSGITLFEGDGGTPVDLYHEAWHGFSQLFLTKAEKIKLYNELKAQPKWANKSFFDIEEDIAEDFRDYAKSKGKKAAPKGYLGKVFQRMYDFLNKLFGKATKQQVITRPRDIAAVKELFDKLYDASNRPELLQNMQPSTENMMFTKLNRAKVIRPLKEFKSEYKEFTESESLKAATLIDSILPKIFMAYNKAKDNSGGAIKILYNNNNRIAMYSTVEKRLKTMFENLKKQVAELAVNGEDVPDYLLSNMVFLEKMITNFGDIKESVEGSQKTGVVAYHLENSRFKILSNTYVEIDTDDPTSIEQTQTFKLDSGNTMSSKDEASEATKTILSSIYKVDRSKFTSEVEDGVTKFNIEYELNEFGEPILVDFNIMWNKLAKILAGSFDKVEMYSRLQNAIKSEPEIKQLLSLLPNPSSTTYKDNTEFNIDVNFWQDLKKPRISYLQLNINKTPAKNNDAVYDARMAKADFPVTSVIRDWNFGFVMDSPSTNQFLTFDDIESKYVLDIKKVFKTFTDKQGNFKLELSKDFLNAIGIRLDYTNKAIKDIVDDPKFGRKYGVDQIFKTIRAAVASSNVEARFIAANPIKYIMEGTTKDPITNTKTNVSNSRVKELAA